MAWMPNLIFSNKESLSDTCHVGGGYLFADLIHEINGVKDIARKSKRLILESPTGGSTILPHLERSALHAQVEQLKSMDLLTTQVHTATRAVMPLVQIDNKY